MKKIQLVEIASELGAGTRGSSLGIAALKIASMNSDSDYFARHTSIVVPTENQVLFGKKDQSFAKNISTNIKVMRGLCASLKQVLNDKSFPLVLAGDHSTAAATIAGIKSAHPDKRLGVIWIDAHADLHTPYTSPSGNVHGMPLAMALGEDNLEKKRNEVSEEIKQHWSDIKMLAGISPNIDSRDLVFMGVRDTEEEEDYLIAKNNIKTYSVSEIRVAGIESTIADTNDYLKDCDLIYISFDVDSMDGDYVSHGTGTPVSIGFSEEEATQLVTQLLKNDKVCCLEITEVNPTLDEKCNLMAETAFRILEEATKTIEGA